MRSLIGRLAVTLVVSLAAVTASNRAQADEAPATSDAASDDAHGRYRATVDLAFDEFSAGHYAEARTRFLEALAIMPNARVLRALGMVEYELRNYAHARSYLEQALQSQERPLSDIERTETEQLCQRAREYLARYHLNIRPSHARVVLDGEPVAAAASQTHWLVVGDHLLEVEARGYSPLRRELHVEDHSDQEIDVTLRPLTAAASAPAVGQHAALAATTRGEKAAPLYTSPWFWVATLGIVAVAAIAAASVAGAGAPHDVREPATTMQTPPGAAIQLLRTP